MQLYNEEFIIETERLILRSVNKNDKQDLFNNVFSSEAVLQYFMSTKKEHIDDFDLERLIQYYKDEQSYFVSIIRKDTKETIGILLQVSKPSENDHSSEVGYAIGEAHWNKGYVTEALKAFVDYLFKEAKVHKICASHFRENEASGRCMQKIGMKKEGEKKDGIFYHDRYFDLIEYYIMNPYE